MPVDLTSFELALLASNPRFKIRFKDDSWFQKVLGVLVRPFNPRFLRDFTTTLGSTVYFPSREFYQANPEASFVTLSHESVHIWDSQQDSLFRLKYLFPQVLAIVPLALYVLLAGFHAWILAIPLGAYVLGAILAKRSRVVCVVLITLGILSSLALGWFLTQWLLGFVLLGLVFLAPWSSKFRTSYEIRGYGMQVALSQWSYGTVSPAYLSRLIGTLVGPSYYYMCRDTQFAKAALEEIQHQAISGELLQSPPHKVVYDFLVSQNLLSR